MFSKKLAILGYIATLYIGFREFGIKGAFIAVLAGGMMGIFASLDQNADNEKEVEDTENQKGE